MIVVKPPTQLMESLRSYAPRVFLAGSIDDGSAVNWQVSATQSFVDKNVIILNPRRDNWALSELQSIKNFKFVEQVEWEMKHLDLADIILMYFEPNSKAPITLLELGLWAPSGKVMVCCPEPFWKKGNVDVICLKYGIPQFPTLEQLIKNVKKKVNDLNTSYLNSLEHRDNIVNS